MNEAWWIDYMEGELPRDKKQEMEMVLRFSPTDNEVVENLRAVRSAVKKLDDVKMPVKPEYYNDLQSKIMQGVSQANMRVPTKNRDAMEVSKLLLRALVRKARRAHAQRFKQAQYYFSLGN